MMKNLYTKEGIEKMGNALTTPLLVIAIVVMSIFGTYHFIGMSKALEDAETQLDLTEAAYEIDIKSSHLNAVDEFTAAVITNKYMDMYDEKFGYYFWRGFGLTLDNVEFVWAFEYKFSFGVKFPPNWNYELKI